MTEGLSSPSNRRRLYRGVAIGSLCSILSSCASTDGDCTEPTLSASPVIRVVNGATGEPICDAKLVTMMSGSTVTLRPGMHPDASVGCQYGMAGEPGNYAVSVTKAGFRGASAFVRVQRWEPCSGPSPAMQPVIVSLMPN